MDRTVFLAYCRNAPFGGRLLQSHIDGMTRILDAAESLPAEWLAYMLATVFWETGKTMQPIREAYGKSDADTIAKLDKAYAAGQLKWVKKPYWREGWFGRGLVQLTHKENYAKMGAILGIDLVKNPSLALQPDIAVKIMIEGMTKGASNRGDFTGKSLENYFSDTHADPVGARAIINGKDKAELIAGYYKNFLDAINAANKSASTGVTPPDVTPEQAQPDNVPVAKSKSLWTILAGILAATGISISDLFTGIKSIDNPWAFASVALFIAVAAIGGWLVLSGRVRILHGRAVK